MKKEMPTSKAERKKVARKATTQLGVMKLKHLAKTNIFDKEKRIQQKSNQRRSEAQALFEALCQLRGVALKLGQMLSTEAGLLSQEYIDELEKSQYQVPPLNVATIYKVFKQEFQTLPEDLFQEFDTAAFAAASLGQVHRAQLKSGEDAAVKIQYPGVSESIHSDMALAKKYILPFSRSALMQRTLEEVEQRLLEEVDYLVESENTNWFRENNPFDHVEIPQVYSDHTTSRIFTTSYIDGLNLRPWLETHPTKEDRNFVCQSLYDFFCYFLFEKGRFHSDPNMGNFIKMDGHRIGVIDFGSTKKPSQDTIMLFRSLWKKARENSSISNDELVRQYEVCGAKISTANQQKFIDQNITPYITWMESFFKKPTFDFSENPGFAITGAKQFQKASLGSGMDEFTTDFTLIHRTVHGLFSALTKLNGQVNSINPHLQGS